MRTAAFSIISSNYGHYAQALMASVRRHHPDWDRYVLIVGDDAPPPGDLFTAVSLDALALPHARQFCFRYTLLELNTAVKPWMFEHVFARGYDRVVFFDPDILLSSSLDELEDDAFLTLTPHLTGPIGGDGHPSERSILQAGAYNLGFLSVTRGPELERFLRWWQDKLEFQSVIDPARGLFVDQRWIDLAPGLFAGVKILRHEGYNVAYWNLRQRTVRREANRALVNGVPLRFFHFSGFDPAVPDRVSVHDLTLTRDDIGDARSLFDEYAALLRKADFGSFQRRPYAFARFSDGTLVPDAARIAYRESHTLQKAAGEDPFAHPELFRGIEPERKRSVRVTRLAARAYLTLSRARPVIGLIPEHLRKAMREFLLGKDVALRARSHSALPPGLNVVGHLGGETHFSEAVRRFARSCERAGLPHRTINLHAATPLEHQPVHRASIFHVDATQTPELFDSHAHLPAETESNIGCWHQDMPGFPDVFIPLTTRLREIWAPSAFIQSAIGRRVAIPVVHMPHGVEVDDIENCSPQALGVPSGRFTFLCTFDFRDETSRRNPHGAIESFRGAFRNRPGAAALLVKISHGQDHPTELAALRAQAAAVDGVFLADETLSPARRRGLLASCDAYVSLHRSEGFAWTAAEAMYLGKPVIATGWSGNMDYMNAANSCPVAFELVPIDETIVPNEPGQLWAEPDVDHAAHLMRRVMEDAQYRTLLSTRARETMRGAFSTAAAGARYRERLATLGLLTAFT